MAEIKLEGLDELEPISTPKLEGLEELPAMQPASQLAGLDELPPVETTQTPTPKEEKDYFSLTEAAVSDSEIKALADKHKIPMSLLKSRVSLYGGIPEGGETDPTEMAKDLFGQVSEAVLFSLPQFIDKKLQEPQTEKALDDLREMINKKKEGTLVGQIQDVSKFALGATTGAKLGDALLGAKAVGTSLQTGISSMGTSKEGEELQYFATGAALGAVGYGAIKGIAKTFAKVGGKEVPEAILEPKNYVPVEDVGFQLNKKVQDRLTESSEFNQAFLTNLTDLAYGDKSKQDLLSLPEDQFNSIMSFARSLGVKAKVGADAEKAAERVVEHFKKIAKGGEGQEALLNDAMEYRRKAIARKILKETAAEEMPEETSRIKGWLNKAIASESVARMADQKWGTNIAEIHTNISKKTRDLNTHIGMKAEEFRPLKKAYAESGMSEQELYDFLDKGVAPTDPAKLQVAKGFRQFFDNMREEVNSLGMDIKYRDNYIPHVAVDEEEMVLRLRDKAKELGITGFTKDVFKKMREEGDEFLRGLEVLKGGPLKNAEDATRFLGAMKRDLSGMQKLKTKAMASFAREGEIPEFLREKDITALTNKWITGTLKHVYLRDDMRALKSTMDMVKDKDPALGMYYSSLLQDLSGGIRQGTLASEIRMASQKLKHKYEPLAERATGVKKAAYTMAANAPDVLKYFVGQAYPNYLGMNPKSVVTNLTQPLTATVPELGYALGVPKVLGAYADTAAVFALGRKITLKDPLLAKELGKQVGEEVTVHTPAKILQNEGLMGNEQHRAIQAVLHKNSLDNPLAQGLKTGIDKMGDFAMASYSGTETINRYTTYKLAESVGEDLINGLVRGDKSLASKQAVKFLDSLQSPAHKKAIQSAINSGEPDKVKRVLAEYLISKTIFNYDKASAAQFARSAGPLFSMFTKFPTAVGGDLVEIYNQRGAAKGTMEAARKYAAPMILLAMLDKAMFGGDEREGVAQLTLGKTSPMSRMAPGSAVVDLFREGYTPPVMELGRDLTNAIVEMDEETWTKFAESFAKGYVPGAVWYRAYTQVADAMEE